MNSKTATVLFLIFFFPVGLFLMWRNQHFSKKARIIVTSVIGFLFFLAMVSPDSSEPTSTSSVKEEAKEEDKEKSPKVEEKKEEKKEEPKAEPKEELYVKVVSMNHDPSKEVITVETETNIPDGTEIYIALKGEGEYDYPVVPNSGTVENGKLAVTLGDFEDEMDGREMIPNGKFPVLASFSINKEHDRNVHLIESLGEFKEFEKKYTIKGEVKETDAGYIIEGIPLGEIEITEGYSQEQINAKRLENKKAEAKIIDFKQLDKNADRHAGEYVKFTGEIVQIMEGNGMTNIRLAVTKTSYGYSSSDIIYIEYEGYTDFVQDDIVTVYGMVYGSYSYTSQAGYNITLPGIIADIIE